MVRMNYTTTYLKSSPFGRNNKGQNIAGVNRLLRNFGVSAVMAPVPQAAFIAGLPQKSIMLSRQGLEDSKDMAMVWRGLRTFFTIICTGQVL